MADQTTSYNAESKGTSVNILPENLFIVGLDCADDERPELRDPERLRLEIDEEMVRNIKEYGIQEVVRIKKFPGDDRTFVASGRRRVIHARKANEELPADQKILVPCLPIGRGSDASVTHIIGNRFRVDNTPLMNAEEAGRQLDRGRSEAQVCAIFGIERQTLRNWLDLRSAPPPIKKAVELGQITATIGVEIARRPPLRCRGDAHPSRAVRSIRQPGSRQRTT